MSFKRSRVEINHYSKTKSVTVLVEYKGQLEVENIPVAKESMMLLVGDAWHSYCEDIGLNPVETMKMIDAHVRADRSKA